MIDARKPMLIVMICGLVLGGVGLAAAQSPPPNLTRPMIDRPQMTREDETGIRGYLSYWTQFLVNESTPPRETLAAREQLLLPIRTPGISPAFRAEYGQTAIGSMRDAISRGNPVGVANAFIVLSAIANDNAMDAMLNYTDPQRTPRVHVRQLAARSILVALRAGLVDPGRVPGYTRQIAGAIRSESDNLAVRYLLSSLAYLGQPMRDTETDDAARAEMVAVIGSVVGKVEQHAGETPCQLVDAYRLAVGEVLGSYILLDSTEQTTLGRRIGPILSRFLKTVAEHWNPVQDDNGWKTTYERAVQRTQDLLNIVDQRVRSANSDPVPNLVRPFREGDRPEFDRGVNTWIQIHQGSSYGR